MFYFISYLVQEMISNTRTRGPHAASCGLVRPANTFIDFSKLNYEKFFKYKVKGFDPNVAF